MHFDDEITLKDLLDHARKATKGPDGTVFSPRDDPFQIVGHCLLALSAAGLGGIAAPLVCDLARRQQPSPSGA